MTEFTNLLWFILKFKTQYNVSIKQGVKIIINSLFIIDFKNYFVTALKNSIKKMGQDWPIFL